MKQNALILAVLLSPGACEKSWQMSNPDFGSVDLEPGNWDLEITVGDGETLSGDGYMAVERLDGFGKPFTRTTAVSISGHSMEECQPD